MEYLELETIFDFWYFGIDSEPFGKETNNDPHFIGLLIKI